MKRGPSPSRPSPPRAKSPRASSPNTPALPTEFPEDTRVFVENQDGEVFSGTLAYIRDRFIPPWVFHSSLMKMGEDNFLMAMPSGDSLASILVEHQRIININDEMPSQPRCFILYGNDNILLARLQPYETFPQHRPTVPRGFVRMPVELLRYYGDFQHFRGSRPSWLR